MLLILLFLVPPVFLLIKKSLFGREIHLPPGPSAWQVLGNISKLRKRPHVAFGNLAKLYGPLMSLRLGTQVVVIASSAGTAREILRTQDRNFSGRYLPYIYYKVPGAPQSSLSMAKECNETWRYLRGITQNFIFSSKAVELKAEVRKEKAMEVVKHLRSKQGEVVRLDDIIITTVANIISNILVSRNMFDIRGEDENDEKLKAFINGIIEMVSSLGMSDLFPFMKNFDFHTERKGVELHKIIMCIWGDIVRERRARRAENRAISAQDFLDVLIAENTLSSNQICLVFMELFSAGMDSPSITAIWLTVELMRHPQILNRVRDEIAKAFEGDVVINEAILTESHYFQACIKETLRLHIPGPLLVPHRPIETCKINNYVIPKDSMVLVNAWAISMDPDSWNDADVFNPDRFLDSNIDFVGTHFEYIPFGAGRRMCPGYNLALKEVQVLVATLLHNFDFSLPDGVDPTEIDTNDKYGTTIKKKKPLLLIPTPRK